MNPADQMLLMPGGWYKACNATVVDEVEVGKDSSIWFGCVLRGDIAPIRIGRGTNVQDLSCIHIDPGVPNVIGDYVTIAHRVICHGVEIGDHCLIGMGAILLGGSRIGAGSLIAAGTVVLEGSVIPPRSVVMGLPGRVVRETTDEEVAAAIRRAEGYIAYAKRWHEKNTGIP